MVDFNVNKATEANMPLSAQSENVSQEQSFAEEPLPLVSNEKKNADKNTGEIPPDKTPPKGEDKPSVLKKVGNVAKDVGKAGLNVAKKVGKGLLMVLGSLQSCTKTDGFKNDRGNIDEKYSYTIDYDRSTGECRVKYYEKASNGLKEDTKFTYNFIAGEGKLDIAPKSVAGRMMAISKLAGFKFNDDDAYVYDVATSHTTWEDGDGKEHTGVAFGLKVDPCDLAILAKKGGKVKGSITLWGTEYKGNISVNSDGSLQIGDYKLTEKEKYMYNSDCVIVKDKNGDTQVVVFGNDNEYEGPESAIQNSQSGTIFFAPVQNEERPQKSFPKNITDVSYKEGCAKVGIIAEEPNGPFSHLH